MFLSKILFFSFEKYCISNSGSYMNNISCINKFAFDLVFHYSESSVKNIEYTLSDLKCKNQEMVCPHLRRFCNFHQRVFLEICCAV